MIYRFTHALSFFLVLAACKGQDGDTDTDASTASGDLPPAAEVCTAACAKFAECGSSDPDCASDCEAVIAFMAMNNPGTQCATYETGRMDCLSQLTCDELDLYGNLTQDDPERPCKKWIDLEIEQCAIE